MRFAQKSDEKNLTKIDIVSHAVNNSVIYFEYILISFKMGEENNGDNRFG